MKLSFEQHGELEKMSRYFQKLEEMGADLIESDENYPTSSLQNTSCKSHLTHSVRRQQAFNSHSASSRSTNVKLQVIVNEKRF